MNWFFEPHNSIFAAAFVVLLCLALLEAVSLLLGLGASHFLSDVLNLPDADGDGAPDAGADADGQADSGFLHGFLSWLEIGKVPLLISLSAFLAAFSIGGMTLQQALISLGVGPWPPVAAAAAVFFLGLPALKLSNRLLAKLWPKDETSAFSPEQFIGRVGMVTIGTATGERPAEVKVVGPDGRAHYLMTVVSGEPVPQGGEVLILERDAAKGIYRGVRNTDANLSPALYS